MNISIAFRCFSVLLVLASTFPPVALAQDESPTIGRYRILLNTGERLDGKDGRLFADHFEGNDRRGHPSRYELSEIVGIERKTGSKAGEYAAMGAGFGLITSLLAILQVEADSETELDSSAVIPVTGVLVGLSMLVGAAIGASNAEWESVDIGSRSSDAGRQHRLTLSYSWTF